MTSKDDEEPNANWLDIAVLAFEKLEDCPTLRRVYAEVTKINKVAKLQANRAPKETVRDLIQRHCADKKKYRGSQPLFQNPKRGLWVMDRAAAAARWKERAAARQFLHELGL
jgi:hypothetical protein